MVTIQVLTEDYEIAMRLQDAGLHIGRIMGGYQIRIESARDMQKAYQILTTCGLLP